MYNKIMVKSVNSSRISYLPREDGHNYEKQISHVMSSSIMLRYIMLHHRIVPHQRL